MALCGLSQSVTPEVGMTIQQQADEILARLVHAQRLREAAPDMHALLQRVLSASNEEYWDKTYECLDDIRACIARIDGDAK